MDDPAPLARVTLGLRANLPQFLLLILITAFIGGMLGSERTVVADIAKNDFGIAKATIALSFIISFGVVKALANLFAGRLADRAGRRRVLIVGWLVALPVPLLVMFAPNWWYIVGANMLLGLNQGLTWSVTIAMKMDMARPDQRGAAVGINEFTGYISIALTALAAGWLAQVYGSRVEEPSTRRDASLQTGFFPDKLAATLPTRGCPGWTGHEDERRSGVGACTPAAG